MSFGTQARKLEAAREILKDTHVLNIVAGRCKMVTTYLPAQSWPLS